mmetsp:Transcript_57175/g.133729  ORF Transcript_57175/g.133729 Transcript_57175/m.133729 type:complete len:724 (+) Transcript_57175:519-2690(+)
MDLLLHRHLDFLIDPLHLGHLHSVLLDSHLRHVSMFLHRHLHLLLNVLNLRNLHVLLDCGDLGDHDLLLHWHLHHIVSVFDLRNLHGLLNHIDHRHVTVSDLWKLNFLVDILHDRHLYCFLHHHWRGNLDDLLNRHLNHFVDPFNLRNLNLIGLHVFHRLCSRDGLGNRHRHGSGEHRLRRHRLRRRLGRRLGHGLRYSSGGLRDHHHLLLDHGLLPLHGLMHHRGLFHLHHLELVLNHGVHPGVGDLWHLDDLLFHRDLRHLHHFHHNLWLRDLHNDLHRVLHDPLLLMDDGHVHNLLDARLNGNIHPLLYVEVGHPLLLHDFGDVDDFLLIDGNWHLNNLLNLRLEDAALLNHLRDVDNLDLLLHNGDVDNLLHLHLPLTSCRFDNRHMDHFLLGHRDRNFHHLLDLLHDRALLLADNLGHLDNLHLLLLDGNVDDLLHGNLFLPGGGDYLWHMDDFLLDHRHWHLNHLFNWLVDDPLLGDDDRLLHNGLPRQRTRTGWRRIQEDWWRHHHENGRGLHHLRHDWLRHRPGLRRHRGRGLGGLRRQGCRGRATYRWCRCGRWGRCWHGLGHRGLGRQGRSRSWQVHQLAVLGHLLESLHHLHLWNLLLRDDFLDRGHFHNVLGQLTRHQFFLHDLNLLCRCLQLSGGSRDIDRHRFLLRGHCRCTDHLDVRVRAPLAWHLNFLRVDWALDGVPHLASHWIPGSRKHGLQRAEVERRCLCQCG